MKHYQELIVWKRSMSLVESIYRLSSQLPKEELYGLRSQLTRAAVSIPTNIAEGQARPGKKEFLYFLGIARGSLAELETLIIICGNLSLLPPKTQTSILESCTEVGKLLTGLTKALRANSG